MYKCVIFTPTRLPGIDVTLESLKRQKVNNDTEILWIVADELVETRSLPKLPSRILYHAWREPKREGYERNLAASYNRAILEARDYNADCLITLQDYIWVPEDGVRRFIEVTKYLDDKNIKHILTGICHIADEPKIAPNWDLDNPDSIFPDASYAKDKPQKLWWEDVRKVNNANDETNLVSVSPVEWEANWGLISREALHDERLMYDEDFDKYVAYENQDYSFKANNLGYQTIVDIDNEVISFPHKQYWPEQEAHEAPLTERNRLLLKDKYE